MARLKKYREASIVHFSFFDLLFGAFGAFVFLMIMQVLATLNMVDVDIQKMIDDVVHEKSALKSELEKYKDADQKLQALAQQYDQALDERSRLIDEQKQLTEKNADLTAKAEALQDEMRGLLAVKAELEKKDAQSEKTGDVIRALEEEKKKLEKSLDQTRQKLAALKTSPLKLKTTSLPTIITGENVNIALAAEGGSPPYTWKMDGRLPEGLSFNQITGSLDGVAKSTGDYHIRLTVEDARAMRAETKGDITVKVVKKYVEPKKKVSPMFLVMALISSVLLLYILWGKFKFLRLKRKMEKEGWQLDARWIKKR